MAYFGGKGHTVTRKKKRFTASGATSVEQSSLLILADTGHCSILYGTSRGGGVWPLPRQNIETQSVESQNIEIAQYRNAKYRIVKYWICMISNRKISSTNYELAKISTSTNYELAKMSKTRKYRKTKYRDENIEVAKYRTRITLCNKKWKVFCSWKATEFFWFIGSYHNRNGH